MILAKQLTKTYSQGKSQLPVLRGVDLNLPSQSFVTLMGASGSGKSSLLHILATIDRPDSGELYLENKRVDQWTPKEQTDFRLKQVGIIFQSFHLLPYLNALENVSIPLYLRGMNRFTAKEMSMDILSKVGLENRWNHSPRELSGGEQQRVAIARALVHSPALVLADEPTGNLDSKNSDLVLNLLQGLRQEKSFFLFLVTHNPDIGKLGDIRLKMEDGNLVNP